MYTYPQILYNELYNHWSGLVGKYLVSIKHKKISLVYINMRPR